MSRSNATELAATGLLTFLISLIALSPALPHLGSAWGDGDLLSTYVNVDNWGWFGFHATDHYGYPLGTDLGIFPTLDITQNYFAKFVSSISGNLFLGINLLLVLSFPLVAMLAHCSIRLVGLRGPMAIALAISFTFIPFHFARGLGHTYLATLYGAVAAVILAQLIGTGRLMKFTRKKAIAVAVLVVLTAWSGTYYAVFGLILMFTAWLWLITRHTKPKISRSTLMSAIPILATLMLIALGIVPSIISLSAHPTFAPLAERSAYESVIFAGILAMALLPAPISKLSVLADYNITVSNNFSAATVYENSTLGNYGTWITCAAVLVVIAALFTTIRSGLGLLGTLLITSILFFIPWGLNYFFALAITSQIRAWNRFLPIILLLILLLAASVLAQIRINQTLVIAIGVLILLVTMVESVWPWRATYANNATEGSVVSQAALDYTQTINEQLPQNCGILQLPSTVYPEQGAQGQFNDYDHFWVSLTDSSKSWSYGAVKNTRSGAWLQQLPEVPGPGTMDLLTQAGFCGIHLDTRAYVPAAAQRIVGSLINRYGSPSATGGADQLGEFPNWMFFTADPTTTVVNPDNWSPEVADYFNSPVISVNPPPNSTVAPRGSKDALIWWWTVAPAATFTVHPISNEQPLTAISGGVRIPECATSDSERVTLELNTGESVTVEATKKTPAPFTIDLKTPTPVGTESILTVTSQAKGCQPANFGYPQFVQVTDLATNP